MWNLFKYGIVCIVFGNLVASTTAAGGLFGSLLGEQDNNKNSPSIPLIGALGLGPNRNEQNRPNTNNNQYTNNNNNNNQFTNNNNPNRGLLSILGGNANTNKPVSNNLNNLNRYPNQNIANNNPTNNVNNLKDQVKDAEELLERLKELNRLKEQQKLEKEGKVDRVDSQDQMISGYEEAKSNMNGDKIMKGGLKSLTMKKFYFMVKPVVPENEVEKYDQIIYYTD